MMKLLGITASDIGQLYTISEETNDGQCPMQSNAEIVNRASKVVHRRQREIFSEWNRDHDTRKATEWALSQEPAVRQGDVFEFCWGDHRSWIFIVLKPNTNVLVERVKRVDALTQSETCKTIGEVYVESGIEDIVRATVGEL